MWFKYTYAGRQAECNGCKQMLDTGSPAIISAYGPRHTKEFWHPECWELERDAWFLLHPYVPKSGTGGRPKLHLSPVEWRKRKTLLQHAYLLRMRKRTAISGGMMWMLPELEAEFILLEAKLQALGGVPSHWHPKVFASITGSSVTVNAPLEPASSVER